MPKNVRFTLNRVWGIRICNRILKFLLVFVLDRFERIFNVPIQNFILVGYKVQPL